jgi:hypothetical protein
MTRIVVAGLLLCCAIGCGGAGYISGVVKLKGEPLDGGSIITFHREGRGYSGAIDKTGAYTISDPVPPGPAKISVFTPPMILAPGQTAPPKTMQVPAKYADPEKSGLTYEVRSGQQTHDLDLAE